MKFTTLLDRTSNVTIYGLPENADVVAVRFAIDWEIYIEEREWGIKDFSPLITNVSGEYELETWDGHGNTVSRETIKFDFEPYRENSTFSAEWTEFRQLSISNLEIEVDAQSLEVR